VLVLAPLGIWLASIPFPSADYDRVHLWHRSIGEAAFVMAAVDLWWRSRRPARPVDEDVAWRRSAAALAHALLLVLLILVPVTKIVRGAFAIGWSFAVWHVDGPLAPNPAVTGPLSRAHDYAAFALLGLAAIHTAAALWHGLRRDGVMRRMLPWSGGEG
jgi:cytochrome b561